MDDTYNFFILDNFGEEMNYSLKNFNYAEADRIAKILSIEKPIKTEIKESALTGKNICITGKLVKFKNRAELKSIIEQHGGKVVSTVSKKTDILINNDINSTSSKNNTAKLYKIPIISEEKFVQDYLEI